MSQLQQQLRESIRELEQIRKVREHTAQLTRRLEEEERALMAMEQTLEKEQRDVEALEREGLTTMLRKWIGDREEKLEKEREEYLKASLRFNELYKSVQLIRFELDLLSKKEQNLESVERRVEALLRERGEELLHMDEAAGKELKGLYQQVDRLHAYEAEIDEAIRAGMLALDHVRRTETYLREAQQWGQRDMWGGRHASGNMKHMAIDRARDAAHQSRHALLRFGQEIQDIYRDKEIEFDLRLEEFGRFMDVFFDNIITDWMVQQKINTSLSNVSAVRLHVEELIAQLDQTRREIKGKLDALEEERRRIILNS